MLRNARLTRNWPECDERVEEAKRQVRMAMYRNGLGQISVEERDLIVSILRPCCPDIFTSPAPLPDHERELPIVQE